MDAAKLVLLLGRQVSDPALVDALDELNGTQCVQKYGDVYYYIYYQNGISFMFEIELDRLVSIFLYGAGHPGYSRYVGEIPGGLALHHSHRDVIALLGQPSQTGGGEYCELLNEITPTCSIYLYPAFTLNLTYDREQANLSLVCIMP